MPRRAGGHPYANRLDRAFARGEQRRSASAHRLAVRFSIGTGARKTQTVPADGTNDLRLRVDISAIVEQKFDDPGVTLLGSPHQSIGAAEVLLLLNAGAMTDEDLNRIQLSCARGHH